MTAADEARPGVPPAAPVAVRDLACHHLLIGAGVGNDIEVAEFVALDDGFEKAGMRAGGEQVEHDAGLEALQQVHDDGVPAGGHDGAEVRRLFGVGGADLFEQQFRR